MEYYLDRTEESEKAIKQCCLTSDQFDPVYNCTNHLYTYIFIWEDITFSLCTEENIDRRMKTLFPLKKITPEELLTIIN